MISAVPSDALRYFSSVRTAAFVDLCSLHQTGLLCKRHFPNRTIRIIERLIKVESG